MSKEKTKITRPCWKCGKPSSMQAHLMPKWVALDVRDGDASLALAYTREEKFTISQSGTFEYGLFCKECDGVMGFYEGKVKEILTSIDEEFCFRSGFARMAKGRSGDIITKFAAGILLKFGASTDGNHRINLGPWQGRLDKFIFSNEYPDCFDVLLGRYVWEGTDSPNHFFRTPYPKRFEGRRSYVFSLCGYRFICNVDKNPPLHRDAFCYGKNDLLVMGVSLQDTEEGRQLFSIQKDRPKLMEWKKKIRAKSK